VLRQARAAKLLLKFALPWLIIVAGILLMAAAPSLSLRLSSMLGFAVPANFLFLASIAALAVLVYRQTLQLSKLEARVVTLTQTIARQQYLLAERKNED